MKMFTSLSHLGLRNETLKEDYTFANFTRLFMVKQALRAGFDKLSNFVINSTF